MELIYNTFDKIKRFGWDKVLEKNPDLIAFVIYLIYNKSKIIAGIENNLTGVEAVQEDIKSRFNYLNNREKQLVGYIICQILSPEGYIPIQSKPIKNIINFSNASLYARA
ncbi:MAG: hypothetical protein IKG14_06220 [Clostridia bacterium]|nr:hypothetical protein [Clostridia bacterium]